MNQRVKMFTVLYVSTGDRYCYKSYEQLAFYAYHFGKHLWDWDRLRDWCENWQEYMGDWR